MAERQFIEKQKLLKLIEKVPFSEEDKSAWQKSIAEDDISEDLLESLHKKLLEIPAEKFTSDWMQVKYSTDLNMIIKQWRMSLASRHFKHNR